MHHYELLADAPYTRTEEDVLFETWLRQNGLADGLGDAERAKLWDEFFATPKACLRASPLPKKYGFGLHYDTGVRIALYPLESAAYAELSADPPATVRDTGTGAGSHRPTILKAFRSKRA